jgi:hypothetical protein
MGAIAEAIVAYAQTLIDETDGSEEQLKKALGISQLCWNFALMPEVAREKAISEMQPSLKMDNDEFDDFRRSIIDPMIRRHQEMFPRMHGLDSPEPLQRGTWQAGRSQSGLSPSLPFSIAPPITAAKRAEKYPGTGRYDPCPCNSGRKYKFCCGQKGR